MTTVPIEIGLWCAAAMVLAGTFRVLWVVADLTAARIIGPQRVAMWKRAYDDANPKVPKKVHRQ